MVNGSGAAVTGEAMDNRCGGAAIVGTGVDNLANWRSGAVAVEEVPAHLRRSLRDAEEGILKGKGIYQIKRKQLNQSWVKQKKKEFIQHWVIVVYASLVSKSNA